ncbi:hypothetical protein D3C71_1768490 [compost metagenome]
MPLKKLVDDAIESRQMAEDVWDMSIKEMEERKAKSSSVTTLELYTDEIHRTNRGFGSVSSVKI